MNAPRSIEDYLKQLRAALQGEDPALVQDALYDAEEYLRAEVAANPGKSEADVLELIASTYGAPDEVAAAYRETEVKVKAALRSPAVRPRPGASLRARFFGIYLDPRAYTSLFYMLLTLVTGVVYFTFVVTGLSLSAGLAVLIIGVPFFLAFIGIARAIALGEGRLLEAVTGERMPRRPVHPGPPARWWDRILGMLKDVRTWTTLAYLALMLPLGIVYFTIAVVGIAVGISFLGAPLYLLAEWFGWVHEPYHLTLGADGAFWAAHQGVAAVLLFILGILLTTLLLHLVRFTIRGHARLAKSLLAVPTA
ncbi:MAG: sensor domain-containing protein [Proteobacteria bacterium]|nr:sensor domain-containing protein [Pseudomonadota bacterium]